MPMTRAFRHAGRASNVTSANPGAAARAVSSAYLSRASRLKAAALLTLGAVASVTSAQAALPTTGEQRTAVLLVNFQDDTSRPITPTDARAMVFGQVSDFYWEASYGKTFLSGDVHGWFTIPVSRGTCDTALFAREADRLALAAGVDVNAFDRVVYVMPDNVCSGAGYNSGADTLPARTWLLSNNLSTRLFAHEMGHNFSLLHSQSLDCGATVLGGTCTASSYGDPADTMGGGATPHFNAVHKDKLGWFAGGPAIATVTASGRHVLAPYATNAAGTKALRVPRGTDPATGLPRYYYLEYRQPVDFDTVLGGIGNLTGGVQVRLGGPEQAPELLDMTPGSVTTSSYDDFRDSALAAGRSYVDSAAGVTITVVSADANGAVVDVSVPGGGAATCVRSAPTVSLAGATIAAGGSATLPVSITNRDASACAATTFTLARSVPTGWGGTLGAASVTLSPGASASTTLAVAAPTSAAAGSYGVGVGAGSAIGSAHTANAAATVTVGAAGTLAGSVSTGKSTYLRGETATFAATVTSGGSPVAGAAVKFTVTAPGGVATTLSATTGSDGIARASLKLGKAKSAIGSYALRADATAAAGSATSTSAFSVR
ncbi:NEW3 domain-containing protein [Cognatilysobacter tabacisoli]|uniref:NEW3 domain-containing protein n=1 Tax=Cognatilysobacter tabacisoli TaxID=2315424 RepID=UPI000E6B03E4|nr:NEW3 domain-containing protein [Lysobacter tabacisoli]